MSRRERQVPEADRHRSAELVGADDVGHHPARRGRHLAEHPCAFPAGDGCQGRPDVGGRGLQLQIGRDHRIVELLLAPCEGHGLVRTGLAVGVPRAATHQDADDDQRDHPPWWSPELPWDGIEDLGLGVIALAQPHRLVAEELGLGVHGSSVRGRMCARKSDRRRPSRRPTPAWTGSASGALQQGTRRTDHDLDVEPQGPVFDVPVVEVGPVGDRRVTPEPLDGSQTGQADHGPVAVTV